MNITGFVHFFRPNIKGLFKNFPEPFKVFFHENSPQIKSSVAQRAWVSNERTLETKKPRFTHIL